MMLFRRIIGAVCVGFSFLAILAWIVTGETPNIAGVIGIPVMAIFGILLASQP